MFHTRRSVRCEEAVTVQIEFRKRRAATLCWGRNFGRPIERDSWRLFMTTSISWWTTTIVAAGVFESSTVARTTFKRSEPRRAHCADIVMRFLTDGT